MIDKTHDPHLKSWVESANVPGCDFPIQNLPLGVFVAPGEANSRPGVAIGNQILAIDSWLPGNDLSAFVRLPATQRRDLRREISHALASGCARCELFSQADCRMLLPFPIGDYTDFYASRDHAEHVGRLFRPEKPLPPNFDQLPLAYHGRSSSVFVSGTRIQRPSGQLGVNRFGPTEQLDFEMELGLFIGPGNQPSVPIPISQAEDHLIGFCLLNDWSARDVQRWEYQPLGPFLGKNFATTISPWIVTTEALAPFRTERPAHDIELPYLRCEPCCAFLVEIECSLRTSQLRMAFPLSKASAADLYWTPAQMIAHHTSNGCPLRPGDLLGTGTISGPAAHNSGCLLELTSGGSTCFTLPNGETRTYLQDGDEIAFHAGAKLENFVSIGFGSCIGMIEPARGPHGF